MTKENAEKAKVHFSKWNACLKKAGVEDVKTLYTKIHAAIKANPVKVAKKDKKDTPQTYENEKRTVIVTKKGKYTRDRKLTLAERKENIQKKIEIFRDQE